MKPLFERFMTYLEKQDTWTPQSVLENLAVVNKYSSTDITKAIIALKTTPNIGYNYKLGFMWYPRIEPQDTLTQNALHNPPPCA